MQKDSKIYIAGHRGTAGSALVEVLEQRGFKNLITRTHQELDLSNQEAVEEFFKQEKPEYVFCVRCYLVERRMSRRGRIFCMLIQ